MLGPLALKKKDIIITIIKPRLKANSHKYKIEVPRDQAHAEQFDTENGNREWQDAHDKEMFNISVAFQIFRIENRQQWDGRRLLNN